MGSEIRRMFLGKGLWMGLAVAMAGIVFGAAYPKIEGLLDTGKFVNMEAEALKSQAMIFLLPLAAVLPWSDSFLLERQGGFLKSALPRTGRRVYVESKVFTVALGGFLAVFLAGTLMFLYILQCFSLWRNREGFPGILCGSLQRFFYAAGCWEASSVLSGESAEP